MVIAGTSGVKTLLYTVATGAINVSYIDASMKRLDLAPSFWTNDINFSWHSREKVLFAGRADIEGKERTLIVLADDAESYLLDYLREECRRGRITENAANNRASRVGMVLPFPPQDDELDQSAPSEAIQGKPRGAPSKAPDIVRVKTELLQSGDLSPDSGKRARNAAIRKKLKQPQLRAATIERALKDE